MARRRRGIRMRPTVSMRISTTTKSASGCRCRRPRWRTDVCNTFRARITAKSSSIARRATTPRFTRWRQIPRLSTRPRPSPVRCLRAAAPSTPGAPCTTRDRTIRTSRGAPTSSPSRSHPSCGRRSENSRGMRKSGPMMKLASGRGGNAAGCWWKLGANCAKAFSPIRNG